MTKQQIIDRLTVLNNQLSRWAFEYYVEDNPSVSDDIYNETYAEYKKLESDNPDINIPNSITRRIGGVAIASLVKHTHRFPMMSIETIMDSDEKAVYEWYTDVTNNGEFEVIVENKYDGLGISLNYKGGKLKSMATRGDHEVGEDVTHNAPAIDGVLPELPQWMVNSMGDDIEIRGEVLMPKTSFAVYNSESEKLGKKLLSNPRNAAAGAVRQLDISRCKERNLIFIPYSLQRGDGESLVSSQKQALDALCKAGFKKGGYYEVTDPSDIIRIQQSIIAKRESIDYEIDGIVVKVDDLARQSELGYRTKEPVWAIAYKFPPEQATSTLNDIRLQVGRTGKLTPVANITPVRVGGVTVSSAILHNVFDLRKRGVRVGDTVVVHRAGDVIPEIAGVSPLNLRDSYRPNFKMPDSCPACGSEVSRDKGEVHYYCRGTYICPAQLSTAVAHFASRSAMNIIGFGDSVSRALVDTGLVRNLSDIYRLTVDDIRGLEGFAVKGAAKLLDAITASKKPRLDKFIYALGIRGVGESTARDLAKHFKRFQSLSIATVDEILKVPDIGPITALNIYSYFKEPSVDLMHIEMFEAGVEPQEETSTNSTNGLKGMVFVVTGSFSGPMDRKAIESKLRDDGARVSGSVSSNTNYLVLGDRPGADKFNKAKSLGTTIISFSELRQIAGW